MGCALFERSEFAQTPELVSIAGNPQGHDRAEMVLDTFAETKVSRRAGAKPRK